MTTMPEEEQNPDPQMNPTGDPGSDPVVAPGLEPERTGAPGPAEEQGDPAP